MKRWRAAAASLGLLAVACGSEPQQPAVLAKNSLLSSVPLAANYQSPASFRYHPTRQAACKPSID